MSADNPFAVSSGSLGDRSGRDRDTAVAEVSARTIEILDQTRPWIRLMGILLWIGTVLMGLACVVMLVAALFSQNVLMIVMCFVYVVFTLVYGTLAKSLTTSASKIAQLNSSESVNDLEDALDAQKTFWRLVGIITLVGILIYAVVLVFVFSGAFMMGNLNR